LFAAQPAKNSAKIVAKTKFFIFSPLTKCLGILSNLSFINRVKFERTANLKSRGKFDATVYAGERLSAAVQTVTPALMTSRLVAVVFASELLMAQLDSTPRLAPKGLNFLAWPHFLRILKSFLFLYVEARNDIRKTSKNVNLSKIKAFFAKLA
jgi:hypothetical protein